MLFEKKSVQLICAETIFKTVRGNFFEINGSRDIQLSVMLRFRQNFLLHKIINKIRLTKKQENSAHSLGGNYLTNHLVKFLQDRIKP